MGPHGYPPRPGAMPMGGASPWHAAAGGPPGSYYAGSYGGGGGGGPNAAMVGRSSGGLPVPPSPPWGGPPGPPTSFSLPQSPLLLSQAGGIMSARESVGSMGGTPAGSVKGMPSESDNIKVGGQ